MALTIPKLRIVLSPPDGVIRLGPLPEGRPRRGARAAIQGLGKATGALIERRQSGDGERIPSGVRAECAHAPARRR